MTARADEIAIRALFQRLQAAHAARDADAILACYAPDARLFDLAPPLGRRGLHSSVPMAMDGSRRAETGLLPGDS